MKRSIFISIFAIALLFFTSSGLKFVPDIGPNSGLSKLYKPLGFDYPDHFVEGNEELIRMGEEIVKNGRTSRNGKKTGFQSVHYTCDHCHNTVIEDPELTISDPDARLKYAAINDIPFLQGTTFYGTVNRTSWYNGDYYKKYGSLVEKANKSLKEAIQLCAIECSQGRLLEDWEMEAVLAYFWSIEYKLSDLDLSSELMTKLQQDFYTEKDRDLIVSSIMGSFLNASPATFLDRPQTNEGYDLQGDPDNGELIYALSCQHCHGPGEMVSEYIFDYDKKTFASLLNQINSSTAEHIDMYEAIRIGTKPIPGHKAYMPHYTKERMSNQQVEDLRSYIEIMSK